MPIKWGYNSEKKNFEIKCTCLINDLQVLKKIFGDRVLERPWGSHDSSEKGWLDSGKYILECSSECPGHQI